MQNKQRMKTVYAMMVLCCAATCLAQEINLWRGGDTKGDWNDPYKWKLLHVPSVGEAVHFRNSNSVITVNSTVELDNGMMLYGQDLLLEGHGNIDLRNPIQHKSTMNIPASASGEAHLSIGDSLVLSGRIALAANAYATADSKGSVTLKDRSTIKGKLAIGCRGNGSGQVFIRNQSTYRISGLELHTLAENGGSAELHILGGTLHLEADTNPFESFLADPGRTITIDEAGTLRIEFEGSIHRKKKMVSEMISKQRIMATRNCQLTLPIIEKNMILFKAELTGAPRPIAALLADIEKIQDTESVENEPFGKEVQLADNTQEAPEKTKTSKLESLLQEMRTNQQPETIVAAIPPAETVVEDQPEPPSHRSPAPLGGYIVFFSAVLFLMRPQNNRK